MIDPTLVGGVFAIAGGLGAYAVSRAGNQTTQRGPHAPRPGWVARGRAKRGVSRKTGHVGVGWEGAFRPARLPLPSLQHHGYVSGAPGSGKTTLLRRLITEYPGPVIVLDAKGSMELVDTVWGCGGTVWEVGGPIKLDVLDDEPAILAEQLLEGETFTDRAAVYRAIAEHAVLRAATVLQWRAEPRSPARILELLASPDSLREAIRRSMNPLDPVAARWLVEIDEPSRAMQEGFQTFVERLGSLLDSPAGRSLGTGEHAVRLADVLASRSKFLIRLDPRYGLISRKVGAWTLVAMLRLAAELRNARWQGNCLLVVDEPRLLGHEGRHLVDLFGTARDAGIGLVVADQGVAGLSAVHPDMPDAVLRLTGWQMVFRQGSPADADRMSALFGKTLRPDVARGSNGNTVTRQVEGPRVPADWLLALSTAHGWLRSAAIGIDAREIVAPIVVSAPIVPPRPRWALPAPVRLFAEPLEAPAQHGPTDGDSRIPGEAGVSDLTGRKEAAARLNVERLIGEKDASGCRHWRGNYDEEGRPRAWWFGRKPYAYRLLVVWRDGPLPRSWDVHHTCLHRWCVELEHLVVMPRSEHHRLHAELDRAAVVGPSEAAVQGRLEEVAAPDVVAERRTQARMLKAEGKSLREIAGVLEVSYETVRQDLREVSSGVKVDSST